MTTSPGPKAGRGRIRSRLLVGCAILAGVAVVAAANAHLVYVAVTSQPACVAHAVDRAETGSPGLRAAQSDCSPPPSKRAQK